MKEISSVSPQQKSRHQFWLVSNRDACLQPAEGAILRASRQHPRKAYLFLRLLKSPRSFQEPLGRHPVLSSNSTSSSDSVASSSAHSSTSSFIYSLWIESKLLWLKDANNFTPSQNQLTVTRQLKPKKCAFQKHTRHNRMAIFASRERLKLARTPLHTFQPQPAHSAFNYNDSLTSQWNSCSYRIYRIFISKTNLVLK